VSGAGGDDGCDMRAVDVGAAEEAVVGVRAHVSPVDVA
jgi:hypothetical protein